MIVITALGSFWFWMVSLKLTVATRGAVLVLVYYSDQERMLQDALLSCSYYDSHNSMGQEANVDILSVA